ncbi:hypothetical protein QQP08_017117 [Theobroma cacao]|nr:hypothetical protein QQP08_017117 [Theobroma cacao]
MAVIQISRLYKLLYNHMSITSKFSMQLLNTCGISGGGSKPNTIKTLSLVSPYLTIYPLFLLLVNTCLLLLLLPDQVLFFSSSTEELWLPVPIPKQHLISFFSMIIFFFLANSLAKRFINPSNTISVSFISRWLSLSVTASISFFRFCHEPRSSTLCKSFDVNIFDFLHLFQNT